MSSSARGEHLAVHLLHELVDPRPAIDEGGLGERRARR
jgi:hypothetical protein